MADPTTHPTPRRRLAALAVGAALLLAGCGASGGEGVDRSTTTAAARTPGKDPAPAQIRIIEPGAEPRQVLRVQPEVGTEQVEMTTSSRITMDIMGEEQTADTPPLIQTVEIAVTERDDGRLAISQEVLDVEVGPGGTPEVRKEVARSTEALVGMTATMVMDDQGEMSDLRVDLPDDAPAMYAALIDQMEGTMEQLMIPVPDEPMGLGASWSATKPIDLLGASVETTITYTVTALDENGFSVRTETKLSAAPNQEISVSGETGTLVAFGGTGTGESTSRFGHLVSDGEGSSTSEQTLSVSGQTIQQQTETTFGMRPLP